MQLRPRKRNRALRSIVTLGSVALVLVVIVFNGFIASFVSGMLALLSTKTPDTYEALPKSVLASRLEDAENELARIRYQSLLYSREVEKNQELTALLNLPTNDSFARGMVIARPPRTHYDTLLVSVPAISGISVGDEVYAHGTTVGTVSEVRNRTVLVSLFSSPDTTFDVRVGEPSAISSVQGLGGGAFSFELPKEVFVEVGDVVLAAHTESVVAVVQSITDEPERTTVTVRAAAPVALSDIRTVEFVRPFRE